MCTVGWQRDMTIIGSPDSCLTPSSSTTGPSHSDALIHTQLLLARLAGQFELYTNGHLNDLLSIFVGKKMIV